MQSAIYIRGRPAQRCTWSGLLGAVRGRAARLARTVVAAARVVDGVAVFLVDSNCCCCPAFTAASTRPHSMAARGCWRAPLSHAASSAGTCTGGCSCVRSSHAVTAWGCSPVEPPPWSDSTGGSAAQGAAALASGLGRAQPWQPPGGKAMLNLWKNCVLTFYCYLPLRTTAWPSKLFTPIKRNYMSTNT